MASKLLVRAYDVGLGDCIYCRIPDAIKVGGKLSDFHLLIDCGSMNSVSLLEVAIKHLEGELPDAGGGKKRLDLIVVTHEHKDHIAGFDPAYFKNIKVGAVWMNCAMDPKHPQATDTTKLKAFAFSVARQLVASGMRLGPELSQTILGIGNPGAVEALRKTLLGNSKPDYVKAGHALKLQGATIRVLGPEFDIDGFYLGKQAKNAMTGMMGAAANIDAVAGATVPADKDLPKPANIGPASFRLLRSRMQSNALAFAELASRVTNNTSVVLLIEWRGRRLLFVGDAEWHGKFKQGKANGSWNVMWNKQKELLGKPVDFLKIGHHGSENSTPWREKEEGDATEASAILDAILPESNSPTAFALVSTARGLHETIPRGLLLERLGKRTANTRNYAPILKSKKHVPEKPDIFEKFETPWLGKLQPMRTDFEHVATGQAFVDIEFKPT